MPAGFERAGRRGVVADFRDYITKDLLWRTPLDFLPNVDDIITHYHVHNGGIIDSHNYEVQSVEYVFATFDEGEVEFSATKPVILVKLEVP